VDQVASSIFQPLIFLAVIAAILYVAGQVVQARGNVEGGERVLDIAFGVSLLAGVYVVIVLLLALFDEPDVIYDAILIILIVAVFFVVLLGALFGLFELLFSRARRPRTRRGSD
jgi:hypothetical protein